MAKTNFQDVYIDNNGKIYYEVSLGTDNITGKRIKKKARKNLNGKPFNTPREAYIEAIRVKNEYLQSNGYSNYDMTYEQFMNTTYLPYYESEVSKQTYSTRTPALNMLIKRFGKKKLKDISLRDVQNFRTWLLSNKGGNFSQAYASMTFGTFRKTLSFAVNMQFLENNISLKVKAIPKGKITVQYWTKEDFEKVLEGRKQRLENHPFAAKMHDFERDYENRYKGLVFNDNTGKELFRRTRIYGKNQDRLYYSFQNDTSTGTLEKEKSVFVMEKDLDKAISDKVSEFITKATSKKKFIERVSLRFDEGLSLAIKDIDKLKDKVLKEDLLIQKAYEEYSLGKIERELYSLKREIALSHIATINNEVIALENKSKEIEKEKRKSLKWIRDVFSAKGIEKISGDLIHSLVEKIIVYDNHNFKVVFKFNMDMLMGGVESE